MFRPEYTIPILKCFLYVFNVISAIVGVATIAFAASLITFLMDDGLVFGVLGISVGFVMFVTAFFGNFAALRNCSTLMSIFTISVFVIFIVQLSILISFNRQSQIRAIQRKLNRLWMESPKTFVEATAELKCCGFHSYEDFFDSTLGMPTSCFKDHNLHPDFVYLKSCYNEFSALAVAVLYSFFVILLISTIFEGLLLGVGTMLVLCFRKEIPHTING